MEVEADESDAHVPAKQQTEEVQPGQARQRVQEHASLVQDSQRCGVKRG